jgi:hypothetical protein
VTDVDCTSALGSIPSHIRYYKGFALNLAAFYSDGFRNFSNVQYNLSIRKWIPTGSAILVLFGCCCVAASTAAQSTDINKAASSPKESGQADARSSNKQASEKSDEPTETIDCDATLKIQRGTSTPFKYGVAELNPLEAGKKYRLRINVVNPTDEVIEFSKISAQNNGVKIIAETKEIPPFGSIQVLMDVDVPNLQHGSQDNGRQTVGADFLLPGVDNLAFRLMVAYDLRGWFRFESDRTRIEISGKEPIFEAKVPILLSPPLTIDQLELTETANLRDFNPTIVSNDPETATPYVKLAIPIRSVSRGGMVGELVLQRPGTNHSAKAIVNIMHQAGFSLHPESVRLTRVMESEPFEANAILRVLRSEEQGDLAEVPKIQADGNGDEREQKQQPIAPVVELTIGGKAARVQLQRLGKGDVYRVTIRYDESPEVGADGVLEVRWGITHEGREQIIESRAFVSGSEQR